MTATVLQTVQIRETLNRNVAFRVSRPWQVIAEGAEVRLAASPRTVAVIQRQRNAVAATYVIQPLVTPVKNAAITHHVLGATACHSAEKLLYVESAAALWADAVGAADVRIARRSVALTRRAPTGRCSTTRAPTAGPLSSSLIILADPLIRGTGNSFTVCLSFRSLTPRKQPFRSATVVQILPAVPTEIRAAGSTRQITRVS